MQKQNFERKKAIVLFDGNNLYHNLKATFIRPSSINLHKVSQLISNQFNCELIRSIYYNSLPSIKDGEEVYYGHMKFLDEVKKYPNFTIKTRKLQRLSNKEAINIMNNEVSNLGLCEICKPIVLSHWADYMGSVSIKEKGIDNLISVDMIKCSIIDKECNACILISGDADLIPTLELLRSCGIWAATASTAKGYSYELRNQFPWFILDKNLLKDQCSKN